MYLMKDDVRWDNDYELPLQDKTRVMSSAILTCFLSVHWVNVDDENTFSLTSSHEDANLVLIGIELTNTKRRPCCCCVLAGGEEAWYCTVE